MSAKTVQRWVSRWVSAGLVGSVSVRQSGQKGGRPETVFMALSLVRPSSDVQNLSIFPENDCAAVDLGFGQVLDNVPNHPRNVQNLPGVAGGISETKTRFPEGGEEVTESAASEASEVLDTSRGVSKTSSLETPSGTGVLKNGLGVLDSSSPVKEDPRFRGDDVEMPPFDFG